MSESVPCPIWSTQYSRNWIFCVLFWKHRCRFLLTEFGVRHHRGNMLLPRCYNQKHTCMNSDLHWTLISLTIWFLKTVSQSSFHGSHLKAVFPTLKKPSSGNFNRPANKEAVSSAWRLLQFCQLLDKNSRAVPKVFGISCGISKCLYTFSRYVAEPWLENTTRKLGCLPLMKFNIYI